MRTQEVEGGRFREATFRILKELTTGKFTPLTKPLGNIDTLINTVSSLPSASFSDSIRLHIPRKLRLIYDIRNKRDAAHLSDGIDPNLQDSMIVCSCMDWVMAELVRYFHGNGMTASEAYEHVCNFVTRVSPVIQEFDGYLKVLNTSLSASNMCLVLLYHKGSHGAEFDQLKEWVSPRMKTNLKRTLNQLVHNKAMLHEDNGRYFITRSEQKEVEDKGHFN